MTASYDDNTTFAEDEKGEPICYDWLRDHDGEAPPVRVQVKKTYVEKEWRLNWKEEATVTQKFRHPKRHHVDAALGAKLLPEPTIASTPSSKARRRMLGDYS